MLAETGLHGGQGNAPTALLLQFRKLVALRLICEGVNDPAFSKQCAEVALHGADKVLRADAGLGRHQHGVRGRRGAAGGSQVQDAMRISSPAARPGRSQPCGQSGACSSKNHRRLRSIMGISSLIAILLLQGAAAVQLRA